MTAIVQIIEENIACTELLLTTLEKERLALLVNELPQLEKVSEDKLNQVNTLQILNQQLLNLRDPESGDTLESVVSSGGTAVWGRWQQLIALATSCEEANQRNGALLDERRAQVQWALRRMVGESRGAQTYGPAGLSSTGIGRRSIACA
jgi:flagellar biosynthesis/type III secretory pathway chaperone